MDMLDPVISLSVTRVPGLLYYSTEVAYLSHISMSPNIDHAEDLS